MHTKQKVVEIYQVPCIEERGAHDIPCAGISQKSRDVIYPKTFELLFSTPFSTINDLQFDLRA